MFQAERSLPDVGVTKRKRTTLVKASLGKTFVLRWTVHGISSGTVLLGCDVNLGQ